MIIIFSIIVLMLLIDGGRLTLAIRTKDKNKYIILFLIISYFIYTAILASGWSYKTEHISNVLAIPFSFIFGPLLYFYNILDDNHTKNRLIILVHSLPFTISWIIIAHIFISNPHFSYDSDNVIPLLMTTYITSSISLLAYAYHSLFNPILNRYNFDLALLALLFILFSTYKLYLTYVAISTPNYQTISSEIPVLSFLFLGSIILYLTAMKRYSLQFNTASDNYNSLKSHEHQKRSTHTENNAPKEDTAIESDDQIHEKVQLFLQSEEICNPNLNLKTAARMLQTTQIKLTKTIDELYQSTFRQTLTRERIEYTCRILSSDFFDESYDNLAARSGFNSTASFYRNFRTLKNCTPTEYRQNNYLPNQQDPTCTV